MLHAQTQSNCDQSEKVDRTSNVPSLLVVISHTHNRFMSE